MMTLGIETSCDETSCAVLQGKDQILSNIISSSLFRHKPFGGVVPEIASRHCLEQIDVVFQEALQEAKVKLKDIDLIAVTEGPGLIGSLLVGISFAKALAYSLKKPLIGVNHLDAHLVANFISAGTSGEKNREPEKYIGLLVSGGHTSLSFHQKGKVTLLGSTVDDAAGEAYDKVAKMLGLGYPGGPLIDKLAQKGNPNAFSFTKPKQKGRFDFSFSGIKTAVLYTLSRHCEERLPRRSNLKVGDCFASLAMTVKEDLAASFQKSVVRWLVEKTLDAAESKKVKHIVAGGGVSANSELRKVLTAEGRARGFEVYFPSLLLTMDNAGMIARRGYELYQKGRRSNLKLRGNANLKMGEGGLNMHQFLSVNLDIAMRLTVAAFLGGFIGLEREIHGKEAGFRTYALVCLGSALVMIVSTEIFEAYRGVTSVDPSRIAAQVVSGVGFLGAGAIIRFPQGIKGLTTAAGIWTASGIGLACGLGFYVPAFIATFLTLVILIIFAKVDRWFGGKDN